MRCYFKSSNSEWTKFQVLAFLSNCANFKSSPVFIVGFEILHEQHELVVRALHRNRRAAGSIPARRAIVVFFLAAPSKVNNLHSKFPYKNPLLRISLICAFRIFSRFRTAFDGRRSTQAWLQNLAPFQVFMNTSVIQDKTLTIYIDLY
jgi:hypothetical protein